MASRQDTPPCGDRQASRQRRLGRLAQTFGGCSTSIVLPLLALRFTGWIGCVITFFVVLAVLTLLFEKGETPPVSDEGGTSTEPIQETAKATGMGSPTSAETADATPEPKEPQGNGGLVSTEAVKEKEDASRKRKMYWTIALVLLLLCVVCLGGGPAIAVLLSFILMGVLLFSMLRRMIHDVWNEFSRNPFSFLLHCAVGILGILIMIIGRVCEFLGELFECIFLDRR